MARLFLIIATLAACADESPCSDDIDSLATRGCMFALPDGAAIDEAELRERCYEQIARAEAGWYCANAIGECLGVGEPLHVVCE